MKTQLPLSFPYISRYNILQVDDKILPEISFKDGLSLG